MLIEKDMKSTRTSKSQKGTKGFSRRRTVGKSLQPSSRQIRYIESSLTSFIDKSLNEDQWLGNEAESMLKAGKAVVIKIDGLKEGEMRELPNR